MTYEDGELSTVTDGKSLYRFVNDKENEKASFEVKTSGAWKKLEETEENRAANSVTQKYYRDDSTTPTDTFVYTMDKYGKPVSIQYKEEKVSYNYTQGNESQAAWLLASVNDQFSGRTYTYTYNPDGSQKSVSMGNFTVEKVNESEKKYTIGNDTITQTVIQDTRLAVISNTLNDDSLVGFTKFYTYDGFGRTTAKQVREYTSETQYNVLSETQVSYGYQHMLPLGETYKRNGESMYQATYTYDARGNVQSVSNGTETTTYEYDALNRLTKENNKTYSYDASGRMSSFNGTAMSYDSRGRLTQFGNMALTYDNYGNRLTKGNSVYTWTRGRLLASLGAIEFEYDCQGRRTRKITNGSVPHEYYYDGDKLIAEIYNRVTLYFFYDESGVCGMRCNGANYEFVRNIFGDVIRIYDDNGDLKASYTYDAWGNCTIGTNVGGIATINPFRYRGYYYDTESGLYYLMSRYYDPAIGQFISMDTPDYLAPDTIGGVDLYAYCLNNPVMHVDPK